MIAFGPIPSRRFGRSLGINNIPPHICSFCCVYCQVGRTTRMSIGRESFYPPESVFNEVKVRLEELRSRGETVDYLSFVPDGEPTLDRNLGKTIRLLKSLGINIAVVTNSTLLWDESVRRDLSGADWVSVKVDTVDDGIWRKLNRAHGGLLLETILEGLLQFRKSFRHRLTSETMLVDGINDQPKSLRATAEFLKKLKPDGVYLALPTRPPAEGGIRPSKKESIETALKIFKAKGLKAECLFEEEVSGFGHSQSVAGDIIGIVSVHPMSEQAMREYLREAKADWSVVEALLHQGKLKFQEYDGKKFYKAVILKRPPKSPLTKTH